MSFPFWSLSCIPPCRHPPAHVIDCFVEPEHFLSFLLPRLDATPSNFTLLMKPKSSDPHSLASASVGSLRKVPPANELTRLRSTLCFSPMTMQFFNLFACSSITQDITCRRSPHSPTRRCGDPPTSASATPTKRESKVMTLKDWRNGERVNPCCLPCGHHNFAVP
jgi:hypothetical protein